MLARDGHACKGPGPHSGALHVHHIKPRVNFPELSERIENGVTLCCACHGRIRPDVTAARRETVRRSEAKTLLARREKRDNLNLSAADIRRFWNRLKKGKPRECWLWGGKTTRSGYGITTTGGFSVRAHRVSYRLHYGVNPGAMLVCHKCDTRLCCNPHHLFLGTSQDNSTDQIRKGKSTAGDRNPSRTRPERLARGDRNGARTHPETRARGERVGIAKLTAADVIAIRASTLSNVVLGRQYGMDNSSIGDARTGRTWKHI